MNASFEEKSAAGTLLIVLIAYAWYSYTLMGPAPIDTSGTVGLIIGVIVIMVVGEIIYHSLLAIRDRDTASDERDRLIAALAGRAESVVIICGVVTAVWYLLLRDAPMPVVAVHILMFSLGFGEVAKRAAQLIYYRRGV